MPGLAKSAAKLTPADTTIFKCFSCKKILKTKELLDKHSHVHDRHITDNPWFKCSICNGGTCLVPPDLYEFGPTKTCEIGPTGLLKNVLFSKTSEFGPTDFFLDPNLLPLSIY